MSDSRTKRDADIGKLKTMLTVLYKRWYVHGACSKELFLLLFDENSCIKNMCNLGLFKTRTEVYFLSKFRVWTLLVMYIKNIRRVY